MSLEVKWFQFRSQWPGLIVHMGGRKMRFKNGIYLTDDPTEAKHLGKRKGVALVRTYDEDPRAEATVEVGQPEPPAAPEPAAQEESAPETVADSDTPID